MLSTIAAKFPADCLFFSSLQHPAVNVLPHTPSAYKLARAKETRRHTAQIRTVPLNMFDERTQEMWRKFRTVDHCGVLFHGRVQERKTASPSYLVGRCRAPNEMKFLRAVRTCGNMSKPFEILTFKLVVCRTSDLLQPSASHRGGGGDGARPRAEEARAAQACERGARPIQAPLSRSGRHR